MPPSTIPPTIHTPRLTLIRYTDSSLNGQHLKWFHTDMTDPDATSWSLRGPSLSLAQSHTRLIDALASNTLIYAVFETSSDTHLGSIGLRRQSTGPTLPPPPLPHPSPAELDLRVLGYAYFRAAWGHGFATEAARGLLDAYASSVAEEKARGEKVFYVEVGVDEENKGSWRVVEKVGFGKVGFKREEGRVWLGGKWKEGGYWVWGKYV